MSDILEKSLDDIIGENKPASHRRERPGSRRGGPARRGAPSSRINKPYDRPARRGPGPERRGGPGGANFNHGAGLPRDVVSLAGPRPVLRVKNIHPELNGEDLSNLFGTISPVDFVKFDNKNDSIAYVCFQRDNTRSNAQAIEKYDGKKAMGDILRVESATSLLDRIGAAPVTRGPPAREGRGGRGRGPAPSEGNGRSQPRPKKTKPVKKSADDLDNELEAYMSGKTEHVEPSTHAEPVQGEDMTLD